MFLLSNQNFAVGCFLICITRFGYLYQIGKEEHSEWLITYCIHIFQAICFNHAECYDAKASANPTDEGINYRHAKVDLTLTFFVLQSRYIIKVNKSQELFEKIFCTEKAPKANAFGAYFAVCDFDNRGQTPVINRSWKPAGCSICCFLWYTQNPLRWQFRL